MVVLSFFCSPVHILSLSLSLPVRLTSLRASSTKGEREGRKATNLSGLNSVIALRRVPPSTVLSTYVRERAEENLER